MSAQLILGEAWLEDEWHMLGADEAVPADGKIIVGWERFQASRETLLAGKAQVGVRLPNTLDVVEAWPALVDRPLIALEIPVFGDGRAYSQARLLRGRCGFKGQLRAVGDVLVDQISYLRRCGFDAIVPRADQNREECLKALRVFSSAYQTAADTRPSVWQMRRTG